MAKIVVCSKDKKYSYVAANELAIRFRDMDFAFCGIEEQGDFEARGYLVLLLDGFLPIDAISEKLKALAYPEYQSAQLSDIDTGKCGFVLLSSHYGGDGVSSAAICLSRIISRIFKKKTCYISLESFCKNPEQYTIEQWQMKASLNSFFSGRSSSFSFKTDEYGVSYFSSYGFNPLSSLDFSELTRFFEAVCGLFDYCILDTSVGFPNFDRILALCEAKVFVSRRGGLPQFNSNYNLLISDDEFSFNAGDIDIHGQLGSEVLSLAERIVTKTV